MSLHCARILQNQFPFVRTNAACRIRSICLKYSIGFWRGARTNGPNLHDGSDMSALAITDFMEERCSCNFLDYIAFLQNYTFHWFLHGFDLEEVAVVLYDCMWVATPIFLSLLFPFFPFSPLFSIHQRPLAQMRLFTLDPGSLYMKITLSLIRSITLQLMWMRGGLLGFLRELFQLDFSQKKIAKQN